MKERVAALKQQSLETPPWLSTERAQLLTGFYKNAGDTSTPVKRALAFQYLMEHKTICINDGELIVGERGPAPQASPTYPELCCHSMQDLQILNDREKIPFLVSDQAKEVYREEIIPFWQGKSMRDKIFQEMSEEWKQAYEHGIFTEFMEQRAPGHTVLDDKIYRKGFLDFQREIAESLQKLDYYNDPKAYYKQEQLKAMRICADAIIRFAQRHAEKARELASQERNAGRRAELERIAEVCTHVPAQAPRDFWEALQSYWFVHLGVITELNTWDAFNPGRLDQHLNPFYQRGIREGTLTKDQAKELLQCFWVKFNNQPAPPKVGVTAEESGTYTDFANINSGGLKRDGSDGVNEVSYLVLDVIDEMRLLQPSSNIQLSKKNPDRFLKRACQIIRKGWGQPSIFNADAIIEELLRQGKTIEDARAGGASGCVETGAFGKESYILTGYLNLVKILELVLNNGQDPRTGRQLGPATGDPTGFNSFGQLLEAFQQQLNYFVNIKVKGNNIIERLYATYMPAPFLSILIDDCIAKGQDYNDGGARYNTTYIQGVGLGSLTDCLSALKYHIFEQGTFTMPQLLEALNLNFAGQEKVRQVLLNKTPKYGNDDDFADEIMTTIFDIFYQEVNGRSNTKGGVYRINLLPTTCHVYFGSVIGATPDGRRAWQPLSEGISPVQGADRQGPTAVIKSAAKMDHIRTGGTLLNQKFAPSVLAGDEGLNKLTHLVRAYFKLDGHHIQFNVVDAKILREAQRNPEQYRDLIVRVAGYSDYFCNLSKALQDEIIARTEHNSI
ncbi:pyruvate formate-lyase [Desulforamulus reducens MI-1]|uniref:Pyruvate formate-lyase n=1 Tax=Desulforamulus reducens (strain ATCC BAA-1160 / DSM 100696 / MI-1) TaxID=349161 RepID=A4J8R5_DESRM|nr:trans-4-hydroxy-L-proline dehydratase [Desulforamulus reducens]ABO51468.1 pyruvate formate-lyase [Desulforamulus reducens MI-1]